MRTGWTLRGAMALSALVVLAGCSGGSGETSSSSPTASSAELLGISTDQLQSLATVMCDDLQKQLTRAEEEFAEKAQAIETESDASMLRAMETWARDYQAKFQRGIAIIARKKAAEVGIAQVPQSLDFLTEEAFVGDLFTECDKADEWNAVRANARQMTEEAQDAAYSARETPAPEKKKPEKKKPNGGNSRWFPAGYQDVGQGIAVKWLKPGSIECNILVEWCWGINVVAEQSCPSGLIVELDIFDANGSKIDTVYDSLGSLQSSETGVMNFGTFEAEAKSARVASVDCF